jgi:hypothetical protein
LLITQILNEDYTDFPAFLIEFPICAIGSESVESEISGLFQKSQKTLDKSNEGVIMWGV